MPASVFDLQHPMRSPISVLPYFVIIGHSHEFGWLKGIPMKQILRTLVLCLWASSLVLLPAIGMTANFELSWDPNCNADADLEGYYIYYKKDASVVDDPSGAIDYYAALSDIDFDPDNPSYLIADLVDGVRYCFAVTAWYGDEESGMSNEVCGINGTYATDPNPDPDPGPDPDPDPDPDPAPEPDPDPDPAPGINPDPDPDPGAAPTPDPSPQNPGMGGTSSGSGSSGGCFIGSLK
jgi:hypothetical protein